MDCGRPRQVSELWAALVRTTGLSNLPPWRACERTGQHLGRGEVTRGTRAGASRASTTVLVRRFRADPHEVGRIEGLGLDSLELAEHVDQGQRRPRAGGGRAGELVDQGQRPPAGHSRRHGTDQQFSHPVSSLTRASDASDARRGRVHSRTLAMATGRPKIYIYIQTDRDKTPILYKRD